MNHNIFIKNPMKLKKEFFIKLGRGVVVVEHLFDVAKASGGR